MQIFSLNSQERDYLIDVLSSQKEHSSSNKNVLKRLLMLQENQYPEDIKKLRSNLDSLLIDK